MKTINSQTCFYFISAIILLAGLGSAIFIYQSAKYDSDSDSEYEVINGRAYPGAGYSKRYVHDLQAYGGNFAVLSDEIMHWFTGLWLGKSLAYTIAWITIFISLGFFVAAKISRSP